MLQSLVLVCSLCIDSFVASMAYSTSKIRIPKLSAIIIDCICTITLAISLIFGSIIKNILPQNLPEILGFSLLLILGTYRLFEYIFKSYLSNKIVSKPSLEFKLFDFIFVLKVYCDERSADFDNSKILSPKESIYLGTALSLDSIAVGFSCSLCTINYLEIILLSLFIGFIAIYIGNLVGRKFAIKKNLELSWLSGLLLILLAFLRLL